MSCNCSKKMGRRKKKVAGISVSDIKKIDWTIAGSMGVGSITGFTISRIAQGVLNALEVSSTGETLQDKFGENTVNIALAVVGAGGSYLAAKKMGRNSAVPVEFAVATGIGMVVGGLSDLVTDNVVTPLSDSLGVQVSGTGYYGSRSPRYRAVGATKGWDTLQGPPTMNVAIGNNIYKDRNRNKGAVGSIENLQGRNMLHEI
ncbi:MAG: hypothetical protein ACPG5B_06810 [Chitinophagales bacterium]